MNFRRISAVGIQGILEQGWTIPVCVFFLLYSVLCSFCFHRFLSWGSKRLNHCGKALWHIIGAKAVRFHRDWVVFKKIALRFYGCQERGEVLQYLWFAKLSAAHRCIHCPSRLKSLPHTSKYSPVQQQAPCSMYILIARAQVRKVLSPSFSCKWQTWAHFVWVPHCLTIIPPSIAMNISLESGRV